MMLNGSFNANINSVLSAETLKKYKTIPSNSYWSVAVNKWSNFLCVICSMELANWSAQNKNVSKEWIEPSIASEKGTNNFALETCNYF